MSAGVSGAIHLKAHDINTTMTSKNQLNKTHICRNGYNSMLCNVMNYWMPSQTDRGSNCSQLFYNL